MKITQQRLKQIIKEELDMALNEAEPGQENLASPTKLAAFFKDLYQQFMGLDTSKVKYSTQELQAVADHIKAILKLTATDGSNHQDIVRLTKRVADVPQGGTPEEQA